MKKGVSQQHPNGQADQKYQILFGPAGKIKHQIRAAQARQPRR